MGFCYEKPINSSPIDREKKALKKGKLFKIAR
jgi:hypothetical protein